MRHALLARTAAIAGALTLAACSGGAGTNLAAIDNQLIANQTDPALSSALEDPILVDPALSQQSNRLAVRPAESPMQAQYPAPDGQPQVQRAAAIDSPGAARVQGSAAGACGGLPFEYGPQWASRLPAAFPPYPGGRLTEAAGRDSGDCRMRVVTFRTADRYRQVLDWYHARAVAAGYSSEHQVRGADHVLGGHNQQTDGAFYLIVTPARDGSEVALIVNNGR
jgi:hypothetical protein